MKILFYKEANRWYADIPNISKEDCEMVLGADSLLDRLSLGYDKVEVEFADIDSDSSIYRYHLTEHDEYGGVYTDGNETFWLCNVTHDVFGEHPNMLYINKIMYK